MQQTGAASHVVDVKKSQVAYEKLQANRRLNKKDGNVSPRGKKRYKDVMQNKIACSTSFLATTLATALWISACSAPPADAPSLHREGESIPLEKTIAAFLATEKAFIKEVQFDGGFTLIGYQLPEKSTKGGDLKGVLYWRVDGSISSAPKVFMHAQIEGAKLNQAQGDHALAKGAFDLLALPKGDVVVDPFTLRVPKNYVADKLEIRIGLYEGKNRWEVDKGEHDDDNRVHLADVSIEGGTPSLPTVKANLLKEPLVLDGKLDESAWKSAQRIGPFMAWNGTSRIRNSTYAKLLYDKDYLYVAFECDDKDIHTPYLKRDDPLYKSEAVEIFIDADGDKDEYVELQASPNDLQFDASFKGGPRKNFNTKYNAEYETKALLSGTFNDAGDVDKGWTSEWKIRISSLKDVPRPPQAGDEWKINLFRLDRIRKNGKVIRSEASAWSSPYSGDFHNLKRFGTLRFMP
ncbi:MAG: hypothetical protein GY822_16730 [Deltaproteobacteria bacterium]|nr:hypothetical protein [Deltaproteobacteria bacterium]